MLLYENVEGSRIDFKRLGVGFTNEMDVIVTDSFGFKIVNIFTYWVDN